jgi:hypothetical protein
MTRKTLIAAALLFAGTLAAMAQSTGAAGQFQPGIGPTGTMYDGNNAELAVSNNGSGSGSDKADAINGSTSTDAGSSPQNANTSGTGANGPSSATDTSGPSTAAGSTAPTAATGNGVAGSSLGGNRGGGEH